MTDRDDALAWLAGEKTYIDRKGRNRSDDDNDLRRGLIDGVWHHDINSYFYRASILGLETPLGKQAAAKGVAVAVELLEAIIRVYGPLPEPGHPSGEIV